MANLRLCSLILDGTEPWNEWRTANPNAEIDLTNVDLSGCSLRGINLGGADLAGARFRDTYLDHADLSAANLVGAVFIKTSLIDTNFTMAIFGSTRFVDVDLTESHGLHTTLHRGPSEINGESLRRAQGSLDADFLEGCGLTDTEILFGRLYNRDLTNDKITSILYEIQNALSSLAIQIVPILISYSHDDMEFVLHLERAMHARRVRCWRDQRELVAGPIEDQIDAAIRSQSAVVVVLSRHSIRSDWVQWEVQRAREAEKAARRFVLCPIALDDAWKDCDWPGPLLEQLKRYYVLDFAQWKNRRTFSKQLEKLLRGLRLNYSKPS